MAASVSADSSAWIPGPLLANSPFDQRTAIAVTLAALVVIPIIASYLLSGRNSKVPILNPPGLFQLESQKQLEFAANSQRMLREAKERFAGKPYMVHSNMGSMIVLPGSLALEVKNEPALNFRKAFSETLPLTLEGASEIAVIDHPAEVMQKVVTKHLTKRLNTITKPLAEEASFATTMNFKNTADWTEVGVYSSIVDIIARLSSRIFLGAEICRNDEWLELTKTYAVAANTARLILTIYPYWIRPIVYVLSRDCRDARAMKKRARAIVEPMVAKRRQERRECLARNAQPPVYNDAIEWAELEMGSSGYDPTDLQINLSFAAMHTTTDLLCSVMAQLARRPDYVQALRDEISQVLSEGGWSKVSLYKLKLLDSAIKEAQRLKPSSAAGLIRRATKDVELPSGVKIPKGQLTCVDVYGLRDPELYPEPEKFDIYRFRNMRETEGGEHKAQLVSTVPEHITFGLGKYACPGRFFAANEVKLALCHLLLKFDWRVPAGEKLDIHWFGMEASIDPKAKLMYRARKPEVDLDALEIKE